MPFYKVMVTVPVIYIEIVEADDEDQAVDKVAGQGNAEVPYIGETWYCDEDPDWDNAVAEELDGDEELYGDDEL